MIAKLIQRICGCEDNENGEKIDIIAYSENMEDYIKNALAPARILDIVLHPDNKEAKVLVEEDVFSLAIGKDGQNVRLAVKLTGWKIDILSDSQVDSLEDVVKEVHDGGEED